jgi:hypothetical protein
MVIPACPKLFFNFKLSNIVLLNTLTTRRYPLAQGGDLCRFFRMGGREVLKKFLKLHPRIRLVPPGDHSKKILQIKIYKFLESESELLLLG